jgi:hypothetical protein
MLPPDPASRDATSFSTWSPTPWPGAAELRSADVVATRGPPSRCRRARRPAGRSLVAERAVRVQHCDQKEPPPWRRTQERSVGSCARQCEHTIATRGRSTGVRTYAAAHAAANSRRSRRARAGESALPAAWQVCGVRRQSTASRSLLNGQATPSAATASGRADRAVTSRRRAPPATRAPQGCGHDAQRRRKIRARQQSGPDCRTIGVMCQRVRRGRGEGGGLKAAARPPPPRARPTARTSSARRAMPGWPPGGVWRERADYSAAGRASASSGRSSGMARDGPCADWRGQGNRSRGLCPWNSSSEIWAPAGMAPTVDRRTPPDRRRIHHGTTRQIPRLRHRRLRVPESPRLRHRGAPL